MEPTYCDADYTRMLAGKTFVCVSKPHPAKPDAHHFVEANTTPSSTAAAAQRKRKRRGGLVLIPGDRG